MNLLKSIIKITVFAVAIHAPQAFAQQYHKWVDAKGVTHYSAKQPIGNAPSFKKRHLAKNKTTQSKFRSNSAIADTQHTGISTAPHKKLASAQQPFRSNATIADTQHHYYSNNSQQAPSAAATASTATKAP